MFDCMILACTSMHWMFLSREELSRSCLLNPMVPLLEQAMELPFDKVKEQFGVSLSQAAARLGVQRQDLVRSCRQAPSQIFLNSAVERVRLRGLGCEISIEKLAPCRTDACGFGTV